MTSIAHNHTLIWPTFLKTSPTTYPSIPACSSLDAPFPRFPGYPSLSKEKLSSLATARPSSLHSATRIPDSASLPSAFLHSPSTTFQLPPGEAGSHVVFFFFSYSDQQRHSHLSIRLSGRSTPFSLHATHSTAREQNSILHCINSTVKSSPSKTITSQSMQKFPCATIF